jgi:hypothetical protein
MIIETIAEQEGYKLKKFPKLIEGLARRFGVDFNVCSTVVERLLNDFQLLSEDTNYIWSDSLLRRMGEMEDKRSKRVEAARQAGLISASKRNERSTNGQRPLDSRSTNFNGCQPNKVKKSKVNIYIPQKNKKAYRKDGIIFLTEREYQELIKGFGEVGVNDRIEALAEAILSKGYKYKSHYHTILSWDRLDKKRNPQPASLEFRRL